MGIPVFKHVSWWNPHVPPFFLLKSTIFLHVSRWNPMFPPFFHGKSQLFSPPFRSRSKRGFFVPALSARHVPRPLSGLGIMAPSALAATETLGAWCLGRLGGGLSHCFGIPSGYVKIAIENDHLYWIFPLKIVIFHSYVSLPEGTIN